jgi:hypothetical protein
MIVRKLMDILENCNPDAEVVMAGDPEGNYYSHVGSVDEDLYINEDGEVGFNCITPELREQGFTDEDLITGKECVVLIP